MYIFFSVLQYQVSDLKFPEKNAIKTRLEKEEVGELCELTPLF